MPYTFDSIEGRPGNKIQSFSNNLNREHRLYKRINRKVLVVLFFAFSLAGAMGLGQLSTAAPSLSSVSPSSGPSSGGTNVAITGSGFAMPDDIANNWTDSGSTIPSTRVAAPTMQVGTQIYIFGGCADENLTTPTNTIYTASVTNPTVWTNTGKTLPATNCGASIERIGSTLYMFGGGDGATAKNTIWSAPVSDPTTWTNTGATLPGARIQGRTAIIGSFIYYFGGFTSGSYAGSNTIFRASTSNPTSWSSVGTIPAPLGDFQLAVAGSNVYIFGGYGGGQSAAIYSAPTSNPLSWSYTGANLPAPVHGHILTTVGTNMYIMGGYGASGNFQNIYRASLSSPTSWSDIGHTVPFMFSRSTVMQIGTKAYIFGGGAYSVGSAAILVSDMSYSGALPQLKFGGTNATNLFISSPTTATATTPAHAGGAVDVVMTNPDGTSSTLASGYTYNPPPTVISVAPSVVSTNGGDSLTITGTDFKSGATLTIGGVPTTIDSLNATTITAIAPAHAEGSVSVVVTNPDGQSHTLTNAFSYRGPPPTLTSVSPDLGPMSGGTQVTVSGTGFNGDPNNLRIVSAPENGAVFSAFSSVGAQTADKAFDNDSATAWVCDSGTGCYGQAMFDRTYAIKKIDWAACGSDNTPRQAQIQLYQNGSWITHRQLTDAQIGGGGDGSGEIVFSNSETASGVRIYFNSAGGWISCTTINAYAMELKGSLTFDGQPATDVTFINSTTLTALTPTHSLGLSDVTITDTYAQSDTLEDGFTYLPHSYSFTSSPLNIAATQPGAVTVQARDENGDSVVATEDILLNLSTNSGSGYFATNLNEDESTRWTHTSVLIPAGQSSATFYYKNNVESTPSITVTDLAGTSATQGATITSKYRFRVTGVTDPVQAGIPSSVTVQAVDYAGNAQPDYTGTIEFSSSDGGAVLPPQFTFTSEMKGVRTFVNGVTMATPGEWCVTAQDISKSAITGQQCSITVTNPPAGSPAKFAVISPPQGIPAGEASSAITVQTQDSINYPAINSTDRTVYVVSTSGTGEFSLTGEGSWSSTSPFAVTIKAGTTAASVYYRDSTPGNPTITFRDEADGGPDFGLTNTSQQANVGVGAADRLGLAPATQTVGAGGTAGYNVSIQDSSGNKITQTENQIVYVSSSSSSARFNSSPGGGGSTGVFAVTIPAGSSEGTVYVTETASGDSTLTVSDANPADGTTGLDDAEAELSVTAGGAVSLHIDMADSIEVNSLNQFTVTLRDMYGNITPSTQHSNIFFNSTSSGGKFYMTPGGPQVGSWDFFPGTTAIGAYYEDSNVGSPNLSFEFEGQTGNKSIEVEPGPIAGYHIKSSAQTVKAGAASNALVIEAVDSYGNPATTASPTTLNLTSTSLSGKFSAASSPWQDTTTVVLPANQSTVNVYHKDTKAGSHTLSANDGQGHAPASQVITITAAEAVGLKFSQDTLRTVRGLPEDFNIGFVDTYGNTGALSDEDVNVTLTPSSPTGELSEDGVNGWASPLTITIPADQATATAYYRSDDVATQDITASATGLASDQMDVETTEASTFGFVSAPASVELNTASGTYTVNTRDTQGNVTPVSVDTTLYLYSSSGGGQFASSPAGPWTIDQVTIPAGQSSASFYYRDSSMGTPNITVSDSTPLDNPDTGFTNATSSINVTAQSVYSISFVSNPQTITAGTVSNAIRIQALRQDGTPATQGPGGYTVQLVRDEAGSGYKFTATQNPAASQITQATIPNGSSYVDVYYTDTISGNKTLRANSTLQDGSNGTAHHFITVQSDAPSKLSFEPSSASGVIDDVSQPLTLGLKDQYENPTLSTSNLAVNLSTDCSNALLSSSVNGPWSATLNAQINSGTGGTTIYYKNSVAETCQISAQANGIQNGGLSYTTIMPADHIAITSSPKNLIAGQTSDAVTVTFYDEFGNVTALPAAVTLNFSSSSNGASFTPAQQTVPAGASTTTFTYKDMNVGTPTITVSSPSGLSAQQTQTITAGTASDISFTASKTNLSAGEPINVTASLLNQYGAVIPAPSNVPVAFSSANSSGEFTQNSNTSNNLSTHIPAGQSSVTVSYKQMTSQYNTLIYADSAFPQKQILLQVVPATIARLQILNPTIDLEAGETVTVTVQLEDAYGNAVPTPDYLYVFASSTSPTANIQTAPSGIFFEPNTTTASFTYSDTAAGSATLKVSEAQNQPTDTGIIDATKNVTVDWGDAEEIRLSNVPASLERGGTTEAMQLSLHNHYGIKIRPSQNTIIYLNSSSDDGKFSASPTGPWNMGFITLPAGEDHVDIYYHDIMPPGDAVLHASDVSSPPESPDTGLTNASSTIHVKADEIDHLELTTPQQTRPALAPSDPITLELVNPYGFPVTTVPARTLVAKGAISGNFSTTQVGPWGEGVFDWPANTSSITIYYRDSVTGLKNLSFDYRDTASSPILQSVSQPITITPQTVDHFFVTNISTPQEQGNPSSVVVIAQDAWGNTVESYAGTITFSSDDPTAEIPTTYTFNPQVDKGSHTFTNAVAFRTAGTKTVTVTDNQGITGQQENIIVSGNTAGPIRHLNFINSPGMANLAVNQEIGPLTIQATDANGKPAVGPTGGLPLHITAGPGAQFAASEAGPWSNSLNTVIPEGLTFTRIYFRLAAPNSGQITAADWIAGVDSTTISNALLNYTSATGSTGNEGGTDTDPGTTPGGGSGISNEPGGPVDTPGPPNNPADTDGQNPDSDDNPVVNGGSAQSQSNQSANTGLKAFFSSKAVATTTPRVIFGIVFLLAIVLLYQMLMEIQRLRFLMATLKRKAQIAADKANFLKLSSHYLRTPITILSGAAELAAVKLGADNDFSARLKQPVANLKLTSESILAELAANPALQAITEPDRRQAARRVLASPLFWLPITASIVLTIVANLLFTQVGDQKLSTSLYLEQFILAVAVTALLYSILRGLYIRREQKRLTEEVLAQEAEFNQVKNNFINETRERLSSDVLNLSQLAQTNVDDAGSQKMLKSATGQLNNLIEKFGVLTSLDNPAVLKQPERIEQVMQESLNEVQALAQQKNVTVSGQENGSITTDRSDLVDYVVSSVLKNAVEYSPEGSTIEYDLKADSSGAILDIRDHGPGMARDPEELFQPFVRAESAEDFTHEGMGLSLYLDRIIMNYMGGSITAESKNGQGTLVRINLPGPSPV